jgi:hypothetical protein
MTELRPCRAIIVLTPMLGVQKFDRFFVEIIWGKIFILTKTGFLKGEGLSEEKKEKIFPLRNLQIVFSFLINF